MRRADFISDIRSYAQRTASDDALIGRALDAGQRDIFDAFRWPFARTVGALFTVARYTTGTVAVTNLSRTVTGTSTTFTAQMVGRKFRLSSSTPAYYITGFTSTTVITIDRPYNGSTASAQTYEIYQDEYLLPADTTVSKLFRERGGPRILTTWDVSDFDVEYPTQVSNASPQVSLLPGRSIIPFANAVGSVATTSGNKTLTGSGDAAWLTGPQGLSRMTRVRVLTNVYHVNTIDSATAITLFENAVATQAATTDWEFYLDNPILQVWPIPDSNYQVLLRYYRQPVPMVDDGDIPDLPESFDWCLLLAGMRRLYLFTGEMARQQTIVDEYEKTLALLIRQYGAGSTDQAFRLGSLDQVTTLRGPRYPANYPDVRFLR